MVTDGSIYRTAKCQPAIHSLSLYAVYKGHGPLLYLVDKMPEGRELNTALKQEAAVCFGCTVHQLRGQMDALIRRFRRAMPDRYAEWFGSPGAKVSPDRFIQAAAEYARRFSAAETDQGP